MLLKKIEEISLEKKQEEHLVFISEFNQKKLQRKLDKKSEKYRLYALNNFDHPLRNTSNQCRLDINHRTLIAIFDAKQF